MPSSTPPSSTLQVAPSHHLLSPPASPIASNHSPAPAHSSSLSIASDSHLRTSTGVRHARALSFAELDAITQLDREPDDSILSQNLKRASALKSLIHEARIEIAERQERERALLARQLQAEAEKQNLVLQLATVTAGLY